MANAASRLIVADDGTESVTNPEALKRRIEAGSHPEPNSGCWIWRGAGDRYGQLGLCKRNTLAHRAAYMAFKGAIPPRKLVCHRCDVRHCVNPDHLWLGDHYSNWADMVNKGRQNWSPKTIKVLVCGGRDYDDRETLYCVLDELDAARGPIRSIVHGAARGADSLAEQWAVDRERESRPHPADWKRYGKIAGPLRNGLMLGEKPDVVIAFPGGRGTADMIRQSERDGYEVIRIPSGENPGSVF